MLWRAGRATPRRSTGPRRAPFVGILGFGPQANSGGRPISRLARVTARSKDQCGRIRQTFPSRIAAAARFVPADGVSALPRFIRVRQNFAPTPPVPIAPTVTAEFGKLSSRIRPGARIAIAVGSRGIAHLAEIVQTVVALVRAAGAEPFILPAMGSHGGATPAGQREVLAGYGVTEAAMGVAVRDSMEVRVVGETADAAPVFCSVEALGADGVLLVNRVKPHTDFRGTIGSGLLKMSVVGLGKHRGAAAMHMAAQLHGKERVIRTMAGVLLEQAPIIGGIAIIENQFHETARIAAVGRDDIAQAEMALLAEADRLMPRLPFDTIDLLIVDWLGKNISGTGMDTNVINRPVWGYSSLLQRGDRPTPFVRRIFVRDLTPDSHGNAIGIGLADVTTTRLIRAVDLRTTGTNALTALTPNTAKLPIHFDTDREAIERTLQSVATSDGAGARVVRIADTLSLTEFDISEALWREATGSANLATLGEPRELAFGADGNLV